MVYRRIDLLYCSLTLIFFDLFNCKKSTDSFSDDFLLIIYLKLLNIYLLKILEMFRVLEGL